MAKSKAPKKKPSKANAITAHSSKRKVASLPKATPTRKPTNAAESRFTYMLTVVFTLLCVVFFLIAAFSYGS